MKLKTNSFSLVDVKLDNFMNDFFICGPMGPIHFVYKPQPQ